MNTWLMLIAIIPLVVFWIIQKIMRIRLYMYKAKHFPSEYKHFGYRAMGYGYFQDIFKNKHRDDPRYTAILKQNRIAFIFFLSVFALTIYIAYIYLK